MLKKARATVYPVFFFSTWAGVGDFVTAGRISWAVLPGPMLWELRAQIPRQARWELRTRVAWAARQLRARLDVPVIVGLGGAM